MATRLESALSRANAVRFLCTGNMVRSAFADLYARHLGCPLPVDSAATVYQNDGLFPETRAALLARGVDPELLDAFQPRRLDRLPRDEVERVVFAMTPEHLEDYAQAFGQEPRGFLLTELLGKAERVADPVLEGASFEEAFRTVARCVERLVGLLEGGDTVGRSSPPPLR